MPPSVFLDYPFSFTSIVSIYLKPYSDIEDPDKVVTVLLEESKLFDCPSENEPHPEEIVSNEIESLKETNITMYPNSVRILQTPNDVSRSEPYLCEITHKGLFTLNKSIKSDIARKMIKFLIKNKLDCIGSSLSSFNVATDDYYEEYQEVIEMAYHSIKFVSQGDFQISDPINN